MIPPPTPPGFTTEQTPTPFGLLIGVLVAYLTTSINPESASDSWPVTALRNHPLLTQIIAAIAFIALLIMVFTVADTAPITYRGGLLLASILTAIVLTTLLAEIGPVHTIMSHPALRWLGERSFSLYLWHWPIVMLIKQLFMNNRMAVSQWTIGAIAFALSIPIAHYSYMWIETPHPPSWLSGRTGQYLGRHRMVGSRHCRTRSSRNYDFHHNCCCHITNKN